MSPDSIATGIVGIVAALAGVASQRAISKASTTNARLDAEKEAYERARQFDRDTIARQDKELQALRDDNRALTDKYNKLFYRLVRVERGLPPDIEEELKDGRDDGTEAVPQQPGV